MSAQYDCTKCLGFCCSIYENIRVSTQDLKRLARHHGIKIKQAVKRFTQDGSLLKRKEDPLLGETCVFFDTDARGCSIYAARPDICRQWPLPEHRLEGAEDRCCYFDVYQFAQREHKGHMGQALPIIKIGRIVRDEEGGALDKRTATATGGESETGQPTICAADRAA